MIHKTIRIVPNISLAALQAKLDKQLAMWYCLRTINQWGSGCLDLEYAVKSLVAEFGYSRSASYRILSSGDGLFWKIQPLRNLNRLQIKIYGLQKVAKSFHIHCGRHFIEIPVEEFVGHGGNRVMRQRAWLYASFHKPQGTKPLPISRASIAEATGVNRRSQQRYDLIAVNRVPNFIDWKDADRRITPRFTLVDGKTKQWLVHRRLGNSYNCRARRGPTGMLHRVNAAVRQSFNRDEACFPKRFFIDDESYNEYPCRHNDPYIIVPADRRVTGRMEWCQADS